MTGVNTEKLTSLGITHTNWIDSNTIVYIETPLQAINAKELLHDAAPKNLRLIIRESTYQSYNSRLRKVMSFLNMEYESVKITSGFSVIRLMGLIFDIAMSCPPPTSFLILGDHDSRICKILSKVFSKKMKIIYLDDGVGTLDVYAKYLGQKPINYFTFFDLQSRSNFHVAKHNFEYLSSRRRALHKDRHPNLFIGSPLVEGNFCSKKQYCEYIRTATEISTSTLTYLPHPKEERSNWEAYEAEFNFEQLLIIELPIEIEIISGNISAETIFSMMSTSVLTLLALAPNINVIGLDIPESERGLQKARGAYDHYAMTVRAAQAYQNFSLVSKEKCITTRK